MTVYDVITLGETMLRLAPPGNQRLEQARELIIYIGGSESNTAVGLARLGLRACWLSRLTDNPPGRLIAGTLAHYGVDTSQIIWTDDDRVAVYFTEMAPSPRGIHVTYDRARSAASRMQPDDLPAELFQPGRARLLHVTGITLAIGEGAAATAAHALRLAREAGWAVSFDVNYRGKLWSPEAARAGCEPFMQAADVLFVPAGDARTIYELDGDPETMITTLSQRYPQAVIVMTLGADGALARTPDGATHHQPAFPAGEVDRIGGGDAFSAGFLYGWLLAESDHEQIPLALQWGAAVAALKYTIPGDLPLVDRDEVAALVGGSATRLAR
jgi:2-dehydro-3-deoxygluconokinase